jgi:hypothetical protein
MLNQIPEGRVRWTDPRLRQAWVVLALAAALTLAFFPRAVSITDEAYYAGQAQALLHGHFLPTAADALPLMPGHPAAEAVRYPFGWPLLLAPLRALGFRAMFVATLLLHLAGGAAVARMLVRRGLPAWLAAAYVFHPVAWVFSHSVMSDVPAVAMLLLAMDLWEQGRAGRGAVPLGYALFSRTAALMPVAGIGLSVLWERRRWRDVFVFAVGPVVAVVAMVALNSWALGNPLGLWYATAGVGGFTGRQIPQQILLYLAGLALIPPFPLLCLALRPRRCDSWALAAVPTLLFFVFYSYHDASPNPVETFFGGQRLILAAHVALIVATMRVWGEIPLLRFRTAVLAVAVAGAAVAAFAWRRLLEGRFVPAVEAVRACRPASVAYNLLSLRVAAAVDAREYHVIAEGAEPPRADVAVIAPKEVSRNVAMATGRFELSPAWRAAAAGRCRQAGAFMVFDLSGRCPAPQPPCDLPPPAPAPPPRAAP